MTPPRAHGVELELGVVRCGGDAGAAFAAELDDGDGKRRALCRSVPAQSSIEEDETVADRRP